MGNEKRRTETKQRIAGKCVSKTERLKSTLLQARVHGSKGLYTHVIAEMLSKLGEVEEQNEYLLSRMCVLEQEVLHLKGLYCGVVDDETC